MRLPKKKSLTGTAGLLEIGLEPSNGHQSAGPIGLLDPRTPGGSAERSRSSEPATSVCPINNVRITRQGNSIVIDGNIEFAKGRYVEHPNGGYETVAVGEGDVSPATQDLWVNAINKGSWNRKIGKYDVRTHLQPGAGGIKAYVDRVNVPRGQVGGNTMWLPETFGDPSSLAGTKFTLDHEFGHILGGEHSDGGLMASPSMEGPPNEATLEKILRRCGL